MSAGSSASRRLVPLALCAWAALGARASAQGEDRPWTPDQVEELVAARGPWLAKLAAYVDGLEPAAALGEGVVFVAPDPAADEWLDEDGSTLLVVRSDGAAAGPVDGGTWRRRFMRGQLVAGECGVDVKVVGVDGGAVGATLDLLIEVRGVEEFGLPPVWQATARARAVFDPGGACTKLALVGFERAQVGTPWFVERTRGVLARASHAAEVLAVGADRWSTRLDDPGLTAFFGHQGLAAGDVNQDGRTDLYVAMPAGIPNMLLVQGDDGRVTDEAAAYGVAWLDDTKGVLLVDTNGDGRQDVVSALGHVIVIQENVVGGPFPVEGRCVAPDEASFYSLAAARLDGDDWPEIYGTRYVTTHYADAVPVPFHDARNGPTNHLFQKRGAEWVDRTAQAGLESEGGRFSLAAQFVDVDGDGRLDLYVVNDFGPNQLFLGRGGLRFEEEDDSPVLDPGAGMGASWADVDLDGDLDLFGTNMDSTAGRRIASQQTFAQGRPEDVRGLVRRYATGNRLYLGREDAPFTEAEGAGVERGRWGWGGIFVDFDGDGLPDIVQPAGFLTGPEPGDL